eukprot:Nk52_evm98s221 gene=Nk52_evmTU98s221
MTHAQVSQCKIVDLIMCRTTVTFDNPVIPQNLRQVYPSDYKVIQMNLDSRLDIKKCGDWWCDKQNNYASQNFRTKYALSISPTSDDIRMTATFEDEIVQNPSGNNWLKGHFEDQASRVQTVMNRNPPRIADINIFRLNRILFPNEQIYKFKDVYSFADVVVWGDTV